MFPLKVGEILLGYTVSHLHRNILPGSTKVWKYLELSVWVLDSHEQLCTAVGIN
jgi:hypothetical protein